MGKLSPDQRHALANQLLSGARTSDVARQFGVTESHVSRIRSRLRQTGPLPPSEWDYREARENLRRRAYPAVQAGLEDGSDNYKRANIGVQVLKGVGDLTPDTAAVQVTIQTALAAVPPEWRERCTMTPVTDENPPR